MLTSLTPSTEPDQIHPTSLSPEPSTPPTAVSPAEVTADTQCRLSLFPTAAYWISNEDQSKTLVVPVKGWAHVSHNKSLSRYLLLGLGKRLLSPIRSDRSVESDQAYEERMGAFLDGALTEQKSVRVVVRGLRRRGGASEYTDGTCVQDLEGLCVDGVEVWPVLLANGLFSDVIKIEESVIKKWQELGDETVYFWDQLEVIAYKSKGNQAGVNAVTTATIVSQDGISIITDLDDTIKDSDVYKGATAALNNAFFVPDAAAIHGMAELYKLFYTNSKAAFHYVSASPFQLLDMISKFLNDGDFPSGSITLRDVWSQRSRRAYKDEIVKDLFSKYPNRRFVLIGDAGEKDAEIYARVYSQYPDRVVKILIRDVSDGKDAEKLKIVHDALANVPSEIHIVFSDPFTLHSLVNSLN
ncbi:hypothetical protein BDR26DRAFT_925876 [Obelidium mucronatum]|nr:hypothetical protein BDR26DRAFT_925876 [Obelidium mucronatum]